MKHFLKNWKTASPGWGLILTGIGIFLNDHSKIQEAGMSVLGGLGLLFAKDFDVIGTGKTQFKAGNTNPDEDKDRPKKP